MKKFFYMVRMTFLTKFAYLRAFWFNIAGTAISIIVYYLLWQAVFAETDSIRGFTEQQMITYVVLSRILSSQFSGGVNRELGRWIYEGNISIELLRPYYLIQTLFAKRIGEFTFFVFFKAIPIGTLGIYVLGGVGPNGGTEFMIFFISVIVSVMLMFLIECIVGLCSFYTLSDWGLSFTKSSICSLLSGGVVPIFLFPKYFEDILNYMPFSGMISVPINLFLGKYSIKEAICFFEIQIGWLIVLAIFLYVFYRKAISNVVVQGG